MPVLLYVYKIGLHIFGDAHRVPIVGIKVIVTNYVIGLESNLTHLTSRFIDVRRLYADIPA